jgi:hypothetical protein
MSIANIRNVMQISPIVTFNPTATRFWGDNNKIDHVSALNQSINSSADRLDETSVELGCKSKYV